MMRFRLFLGCVLIFAVTMTPSLVHARRKSRMPEKSQEKFIDEKSVTIPQDMEVCFSPDEPCDVKLVRLVQSAQKSIDVAIFDINLDQLAHELLVASKKMPVRILVDVRQAKGERSLVPLLIKAGAQVRFGRQRGVMHNKFLIVDGRMVETGSFNYTNHASQANNENQIYLSNPAIVSRYQKRFKKIWEEARLPKNLERLPEL